MTCRSRNRISISKPNLRKNKVTKENKWHAQHIRDSKVSWMQLEGDETQISATKPSLSKLQIYDNKSKK